MGEDQEPIDGRYFAGWKNFKWFIREVRKIYSNEPSYFSLKRMQAGVAFTVAQWGAIAWFVANVKDMPINDFLLWFGAEGAIFGYQLWHVQKEKKTLVKP